MRKYDYLIVGAGLFGAVFCQQAISRGKTCLVIDKRNHIGGNCYTENIGGINVHKYGPHIFHTDSKEIWEYINQFADFHRFQNAPIAVYEGQAYNLPFNMNTFAKIFGVSDPEEARRCIEEDKSFTGKNPSNLEEKAISMVGSTIYQMLVKGYTEKQWGRDCRDLPPNIISRLPLRFTYDNNYFNDEYQGIPKGGYTAIFEKLLSGADVRLSTPYQKYLEDLADTVIFTGKIDEYYGYILGELTYRSLRFEESVLHTVGNYQGNAVVNYTERSVPYTRIIEHKYFDRDAFDLTHTVITKEYPAFHDHTNEPYYPIENNRNRSLYEKYRALSAANPKVKFAGRTGEYRYYDMDDTIAKAIELANKLMEENDRNGKTD